VTGNDGEAGERKQKRAQRRQRERLQDRLDSDPIHAQRVSARLQRAGSAKIGDVARAVAS